MKIRPSNQDYGKFWEDVFERMCRYNGLFPKKNPLSAKIIGRNRVQLLKSDLDYRVVTRDGRVGYFDCKCYGKSHFVFSDLDSNQVEQAVLFNEWNVPAGFVVFFRDSNEAAFFPGKTIAQAGPGSRFTISEGVSLGRLESLDLKRLFA